jgi:hypothetical protein
VLVQRATSCGIGAICIRTSATNFGAVIPALKLNAIEVPGWRYPPTDPQAAHSQALDAAAIVSLGLDGFIVDPEGDNQDSRFDWNQPGLDAIADDYCSTIKRTNPSMPFGTTSHYLAAKPFPRLPWQTFLEHSDAVYPQAYWRAQTQHGPVSIGQGPSANYNASMTAWAGIGSPAGKIIPMAGELGVASPDEMSQYAAAATSKNISELHFYVDDINVDQSVWDAIGRL